MVIVWAAVAFERPRLAVAASFAGVLVANTKFRTREADASLAGDIDAQIMLEIGLYAVIGFGLLAVYAAGRADRRRLTGTEGIVLAYAGIAALSTLWSLAPALTLVRAAQLGVIALLAMITARIFTPTEGLRKIFTSVAAFVLVCSALALVFPFAAGTFVDGEHEGFRFAWFAAHPIEVGTFAAIAALGLHLDDPVRQYDAGLTARSASRRSSAPCSWSSCSRLPLRADRSSRSPSASSRSSFCSSKLRARAALMRRERGRWLRVHRRGPICMRGWLGIRRGQPAELTVFRGQSAQDVLGLNGRLGAVGRAAIRR